MTGRELIVYILENGLEDEQVFQNGNLLGFMNTLEAAMKFGVGTSTIDTWVALGKLQCISIGGLRFIPANVINPKERIEDENNTNDSRVIHVID